MTNIDNRENLGKTHNLVKDQKLKGAYRDVLSLNSLPPGTYQLTIKVNDDTFTQRIVVRNIDKYED